MSEPALTVIPLKIIPEVQPGDDLPALLTPLLSDLSDGDVLCVSTKIVSKAMGLLIPAEHKEQAVQEAAVRTVARRRHGSVVTSVVQLDHGPIMAAAGIDASNTPEGKLLLLPPDPDACAEELRAALAAATGCQIAVILTDTSSRIWRQGVGDIALGAAGLLSLEDLRGSEDAQGRRMSVTVRALADEIAAAADLVKGKTAQVPVAIVRGLATTVVPPEQGVPARALSRTGADNWFRRPSLESAWQAMGLPERDEPVAAMDPEDWQTRLARATHVARLPRTHDAAPLALLLIGAESEQSVPTAKSPEARAVIRVNPDHPHRIRVQPRSETPADWVAAGMVAERLRTAIGAETIADHEPHLLQVEVLIESPDGDLLPRHQEM